MKFKEGDKVQVVIFEELRRGEVSEVHSETGEYSINLFGKGRTELFPEDFVMDGKTCTLFGVAIADLNPSKLPFAIADENKAKYRNLFYSLEMSQKHEKSQFVKVPQFAADWIEYCEKYYWELSKALRPTYEDNCMPKEVMDWFEDCRENQELFARAWLDGYEVEQEPLYYVQFPIFRLNTLGTAVEGDYKYLWADPATGESGIFQSLEYPATLIKSGWKTKLTEKEIKAIDERYWAFAVPVEEVEGE
ncbi:DUF1642 domain-containing protein [Listeria monocytogenes]|nr:DUF1642 domain-containing protein [Listeria monocytogenes]EHR3622557.1 DUF1642 domain-containing protein [Listeria monocytogenes]